MVQKTFYLTDDILHLPVSDGGERRYIQILDARDEEKRLAEFYISLESRGSHEYYPLYVKPWGTHDVILRCGDADAPADLFDAVETGGTIEARGDLYPDIYREPGRQQIHFSSRRGWLNDPNGLVYADGTYRMCYQHNPYGNTHGGVNISWGLALSRDGIRFKEYPDAIRPGDTQTHIASGSAIVDTDNLSGKGKGTILAAYRDFEERIEIAADKTTAYDIVKQAAMNKLGKFTKADIMELCPTVGRASAENALKKLVEENILVRHGSGRATFYTKSE